MAKLRVLLTGANGFIAQHILDQFLKAGHSVRAVVRTPAKADQLRAAFPKTDLDFAIVPDMSAPGAFDAALQSSEPPFDTVLHTASPFNFRQATTAAEFLDPAVKGTAAILEGIIRCAPTVRRVVLTSSMAAVIDFAAPKATDPARVYTGADWNPVTLEQAINHTGPMNLVYAASKTFAEKAAWDFAAQHSQRKPSALELVTINPPMVYGPLQNPKQVTDPKELNQSTFNLYNNFLSAPTDSPQSGEERPVPPTALHLFADVRDVAKAHLLAATTPAAAGKRFVVATGGVTNQRIANLFRERLQRNGNEELAKRVPRGNAEDEALPREWFKADASTAREVLGLEPRSEEETFGDLVDQLAEIASRNT